MGCENGKLFLHGPQRFGEPDNATLIPGAKRAYAETKMKMLMIIVESSCKEKLEVLLNKNDVVGYSEVSQVHGVGESGPRMGSRAFPKTSSIIFTVVPKEKVEKVVEDIHCDCDDCLKDMKIVVWGVDQVV